MARDDKRRSKTNTMGEMTMEKIDLIDSTSDEQELSRLFAPLFGITGDDIVVDSENDESYQSQTED